uniref:Uncharacterized protein n=1 Tax=Heterosigma akashiwo TaxID=2829 RepID=A0A7S3XMW6_HETAK
MNLKNTSDQNERFLEARLTEATERLVIYEKLEVDLDTAILRAGGGNSPQHGGGSGAVGELAGAVPTCPRRRVQQAIQLAQRLVRSEGELTSLKEQKDKLEAEVLEANQRAEVAERELQAVQAPTKYMVDAIRKAESEGSAWKVQVSSLEKEKHQQHHRIQCLEEDNMALRKKLKRALSHQKDIASLKAMIKAMQLEEKSSAAEAVQKRSARASQSSPELLVDEAQAFIGGPRSSGAEQYFPAQMMLKTGVDTDQKDQDNGEPALGSNSTLQLPSCQQKMGDPNATGPLETALSSGAESPPTMGKLLEKMLQHRSDRETSAASTEERASFHDEASGIIWHEQKSISS